MKFRRALFLYSSAYPRRKSYYAPQTIASLSYYPKVAPKYNTRHELVCSMAESKVYATCESKRRKGPIHQILSIDVISLKHHLVGIFGKERGLPRSNTLTIPETRRAIISEAAKFVVRLLIETSVIASSLLLASLHFHSKVNTNIIVTNLCRWIAVSLFIKMGMLYSRITSSVPSLDRNESSDWFLKGSYQLVLEDEASDTVEIRQSPGNGSCFSFQLLLASCIMINQLFQVTIHKIIVLIHPCQQ